MPLRLRVALSQSPLVAGVALLLPLSYAAKPEVYSDPGFLFGLALIAGASVLAAAVSWDRCFKTAYWVIPIIDMAGIALLYRSIQTDVPGTSALAVFPILWLAWSGAAPRYAALISVAGAFLIAWSPLLGAEATAPEDFLRPILMPLIVILVYLAAAITVQDAVGQQEALEEKDRALKQSLQDSRRRARLLDAVLDTIDVGVVVLAKDGHVMLMNNRQLATHQLAVAPLIGWTEADMLIFEPDGRTPLAADQRPVARAMRREAFSDCIVWVGLGLEQRAMAVSAHPMNDENGDFNGSVIAFSDVTDMLRAVRAKEDFVASVSHELRTPLTSIIGYLDLAVTEAEDEDLSASIKSSLGVAMRNAERLLVLVADLLTTASDSIHLEPGELSLQELARLAADSARPRAQAAGIRLQVHSPSDVRGFFDCTRLQQVMDNLISNAIKYSPGGGTVAIRVSASGGCAVLEVEDEGMGMTVLEQSQVFNRFFRSAAVKKAAIPGVGLGLGITKDIVEAHGGTISLTSQPGAGTIFRVELPLQKAAAR